MGSSLAISDIGYSSILYPYQLRYLADKSRLKVAVFPRQTGKTFTTTLECVLDCAEAEADGRVVTWNIFSISKDRAKDAMDAGVKLHLRALNFAFDYLEVPGIEEDETVFEIRFPGGSKIRCVAATENTCRGISGNVILDEFGRMPNATAIWVAIFPMVSRPDFKLRVISTYNGKSGRFYDLMHSTEMGKVFSRHWTDIYQAVADGLNRNIEELKAGLNDPDAWAQEFECIPVDAATAWLTYDMIGGCESKYAGIPELYEGGYCYLGVDFGRRRDLTTLYLFENVTDILWLRKRTELFRTPWREQKDHITRMFAEFNILRSAMDETGLGSEPVEWAQEKFGRSRVEGVMFNQPRMLDMATVLKNKMEERGIRIPHDQLLRDDLHSVTKTIGPTGSPRLSAPREHGSHSDRFWACALAVAAAHNEAPPDLNLIQTTSQLTIPESGWSIPRRDKYHGY